MDPLINSRWWNACVYNFHLCIEFHAIQERKWIGSSLTTGRIEIILCELQKSCFKSCDSDRTSEHAPFSIYVRYDNGSEFARQTYSVHLYCIIFHVFNFNPNKKRIILSFLATHINGMLSWSSISDIKRKQQRML